MSLCGIFMHDFGNSSVEFKGKKQVMYCSFLFLSHIKVRKVKKYPIGIERYRVRSWVDDTK